MYLFSESCSLKSVWSLNFEEPRVSRSRKKIFSKAAKVLQDQPARLVQEEKTPPRKVIKPSLGRRRRGGMSEHKIRGWAWMADTFGRTDIWALGRKERCRFFSRKRRGSVGVWRGKKCASPPCVCIHVQIFFSSEKEGMGSSFFLPRNPPLFSVPVHGCLLDRVSQRPRNNTVFYSKYYLCPPCHWNAKKHRSSEAANRHTHTHVIGRQQVCLLSVFLLTVNPFLFLRNDLDGWL